MLIQRFSILLIFSLFTSVVIAQSANNYRTAADSDPEALKIIKAIKAKYEQANTMKADFRLDIEFPGQAVETQQGTLSRSGDKFRFKLGGQEGISDGKAIYVVMHGNKSVNIEDLPEEDETTGLLTPQNLLTFYDESKFVFALQGEESQAGKLMQIIELKPVKRDESEFTKIRMVVDKKMKQPIRLIAFSRDGSRFTFHLDKLVLNKAIAASQFIFDKANYDGYYIEDLRF